MFFRLSIFNTSEVILGTFKNYNLILIEFLLLFLESHALDSESTFAIKFLSSLIKKINLPESFVVVKSPKINSMILNLSNEYSQRIQINPTGIL